MIRQGHLQRAVVGPTTASTPTIPTHPRLICLHWHCSGPDTTIYQRSRKAAIAEAANAATATASAAGGGGATTDANAGAAATTAAANHNVSGGVGGLLSLEWLLPLDRS